MGQPEVLALPTLGPRDVVPGSWGRRPAFPLSEPGLELTYLGRNAVWRAVKRLGLVGREVLMPAYHHGVEVSALIDAGAIPKFVRVDASLRLDLEDAERQLGPATRALYVIHYAGFPQPIAPIRELCRRHSLLLIEDCALATFSRDGEVPLGSSGDAAIFCFYKTAPVVHGGALLVQDDDGPADGGLVMDAPPMLPAISHTAGSVFVSAERRLGRPGAVLRQFARGLTNVLVQRAWEQDVPVGTQTFDRNVVSLGMSPVAEWVLRRVDADEIVRRRRANWLTLHRELAKTGRAVWNELPDGVCPLFYGIRVRDKDRALRELRARGIEAIDFWRFHHPAVEASQFPEVDALRREVVELPCHQDLTPEALARVVSAARAHCQEG